MVRRRHRLIPLFSTRATATFSVALVLFMLGLAALVGFSAHKVTKDIKEKIGYVVLFNEDASEADVQKLFTRLENDPSVISVDFTSPEQVLSRWQEMVGEEEDILKLGGVNPFVGELEVHVVAAYASTDSIEALTAPLLLMPQVSEVKIHAEMVENVNSTLRSITIGLLLVAFALLAVSFVLIFNTVRLAVYSRRFSIYTMKLVGATAAFIRRPFITENIINGLVAGIIASIALVGVLCYLNYVDFTLSSLVSWTEFIPVLCAMIITGMLICGLAALVATNRYLRLTYDEMFK